MLINGANISVKQQMLGSGLDKIYQELAVYFFKTHLIEQSFLFTNTSDSRTCIGESI